MENPSTEERFERLAETFQILASPARLALLHELQAPKTLNAIRVDAVAEGSSGTIMRRPLARQTVREHLDRLKRLGFVVERDSIGDARSPKEYSLNNQHIFAMAEEIRSLARLRPSVEPGQETIRGVAPSRTYGVHGPCLLLVKGIDEGRSFPLQSKVAAAEWVIGRRRSAQVPLDFDPFVSSAHALVVLSGGCFSLKDLPESQNGTALNFQSLPKGGSESLTNGDVIGVGRSLLLFRA